MAVRIGAGGLSGDDEVRNTELDIYDPDGTHAIGSFEEIETVIDQIDEGVYRDDEGGPSREAPVPYRVRHALGAKPEVFMHRTNKPRPQGARFQLSPSAMAVGTLT